MDAPLETLALAVEEVRTSGPAEAILILGAGPHPAWTRWPSISAWHWHKPTADEWDRRALPRSADFPQDHWPVVALLPGKSKEEILHLLALARDRVAPGGTLVAALPNTAGAGRYEKEFASATGTIHSISKHKCRAFRAIQDGSWDESFFHRWRALGIPTPVPDTALVTVPGVFSAGKIDEGSRFLIDHLPSTLRGRVADLGAGWGFLSESLLRKCPLVSHIDLYEADSRALACARLNLAAFPHRSSFHWHDVTTGIPGHHDIILTNPPFHSGQSHDITLGQAFLHSAARALRPNGRLFLVANRQLPYEHTLDALGLRWSKPAENHTFKLLFCQK